jgi:hypothetical protein
MFEQFQARKASDQQCYEGKREPVEIFIGIRNGFVRLSSPKAGHKKKSCRTDQNRGGNKPANQILAMPAVMLHALYGRGVKPQVNTI